MYILDELARDAHEAMPEEERTWQNACAHLHLEVSELIEASRGKGESGEDEVDMVDEACDVLFVMLGLLHHHGVSAHQVMMQLGDLLDEGYYGNRGK